MKAPADKAPSARSLWKGAITFGLVHIPVSLHTASSDSGIDFDWLDKRTLDPVGYKRINKKTGKEISKQHIVRGVAHGRGRYVVLGDDEIQAAYPKATQTIEIEAFVEAPEIPFTYLERPYYLAPVGKGEKVYALLRETLRASGRIGVARVVIHSKQHLAALVASGPALVLNLLRWSDELRPLADLTLPPEGAKAAGLSTKELSMARQLVDDMSQPWNPGQYRDTFKDAVMALVDRKAKAGQSHSVAPIEPEAAPGRGAEVVDLTELLRQSLRGKGGPARSPAGTAAGTSARTSRSSARTSAGTSARTSPRTSAGTSPGKRAA